MKAQRGKILNKKYEVYHDYKLRPKKAKLLYHIASFHLYLCVNM